MKKVALSSTKILIFCFLTEKKIIKQKVKSTAFFVKSQSKKAFHTKTNLSRVSSKILCNVLVAPSKLLGYTLVSSAVPSKEL